MPFENTDALDSFGDRLYPSEIVTVNRDDIAKAARIATHGMAAALANLNSLEFHDRIQSAVAHIRQLPLY
jgi:hypothetical protein